MLPGPLPVDPDQLAGSCWLHLLHSAVRPVSIAAVGGCERTKGPQRYCPRNCRRGWSAHRRTSCRLGPHSGRRHRFLPGSPQGGWPEGCHCLPTGVIACQCGNCRTALPASRRSRRSACAGWASSGGSSALNDVIRSDNASAAGGACRIWRGVEQTLHHRMPSPALGH